jgi:hypothetical protein
VLPLIAAAALVLSPLTGSVAFASEREKVGRIDRNATKASASNLGPTRYIQPQGANKQLPSIELQVDSTNDDAQVSLISYTFTGGAPAKFAFGNRFTLTAAQAPFTLSVVAAALVTTTEGAGFEAGEQVGITVLGDATGSGDITRAFVLSSAVATIDEPGFLAFALPEPVTVSQGDIYVIFSDLTTDDEATQLPIVLPENGGSTTARSFVSTTPANASNTGNYSSSTVLPLDGGNLMGNFFVRGYGELAAPSDLVTGNGQPTDDTLPNPTNLSAVSSGGGVTLSWTAPTLPTPTPTDVAEVEPNDSPATAQVTGVNVSVTGSDNANNNGAPGGFGGDDIEDWYEFTIDQATSVEITLDDGGQDFDLFLYNKTGPFDPSAPVGSSGNGAGEGELIEIAVLAPGTYVVGVSAFDGPLPTTTYHLDIIAAPKVNAFNIFEGSSPDFTPSAENFFAQVPGNVTSLMVNESAPGSYYIVTAVVGASQSTGSDSATGTPCEGGPTGGSLKVKRNGPGTITFKNLTGDLTGATVTINGVGFTKAPKIKANKGQIKQKGPLANGQTVAEACPSGCTIVVVTNAGCSTFTAP